MRMTGNGRGNRDNDFISSVKWKWWTGPGGDPGDNVLGLKNSRENWSGVDIKRLTFGGNLHFIILWAMESCIFLGVHFPINNSDIVVSLYNESIYSLHLL